MNCTPNIADTNTVRTPEMDSAGMSPEIFQWTNPHPRASQVAYAFMDKGGVRQIRTISGKSGLGEKVARQLIEHDLALYKSHGWA